MELFERGEGGRACSGSIEKPTTRCLIWEIEREVNTVFFLGESHLEKECTPRIELFPNTTFCVGHSEVLEERRNFRRTASRFFLKELSLHTN